jgi:hypothetical protein
MADTVALRTTPARHHQIIHLLMGGVKRHIHPAAAGSNLDLTSRLVRGETKDVELRGLEPLTFSLRRLSLAEGRA